MNKNIKLKDILKIKQGYLEEVTSLLKGLVGEWKDSLTLIGFSVCEDACGWCHSAPGNFLYFDELLASNRYITNQSSLCSWREKVGDIFLIGDGWGEISSISFKNFDELIQALKEVETF